MSDETNKNLMQCNTCNCTISKTAKVCPHCGQRKPTKIYNKSSSGFLAIIFIFIMLSFGFTILGTTVPAPSNSSTGISESTAREMCQEAIRVTVNNPSSLRIHHITGYGANVAATQILITQTFSAKNAFGLEKTYDALCKLKLDGKFDFKVIEQGR